MKKLDKLILSAFIGPFVLTFVVAVFILLNQHMLRYFDDIIGKNLGADVVGKLFFYFGVFMIPMAMPLAVLLSSLITFSNLGEYSELTAIKSLGVSLVRSLASLFVFVLGIVLFAFFANNRLVPKAALEAYSLLYDIKQKKPALDLREGIFYDAIPGISIKANEKFPDGKTIKGIIIYDHRNGMGDKHVTVADSGKMEALHDGRYLKLELFDGYNYGEDKSTSKKDSKGQPVVNLTKSYFKRTTITFDLSSFGLMRTDKKWFKTNRIMRNLSELEVDMDSINNRIMEKRLKAFLALRNKFAFLPSDRPLALPADVKAYSDKRDSILLGMPSVDMASSLTADVSRQKATEGEKNTLQKHKERTSVSAGLAATPRASSSYTAAGLSIYDSLHNAKPTRVQLERALEKARRVDERLDEHTVSIADNINQYKIYHLQWHKILASSFACLSMFLIGAPLGTIIRKGGLGIPVLISICFFILFYILTITGEKWAKQGVISVPVGAWLANMVLFGVGLIFLSRARADTRLLDTDFYSVVWSKFRERIRWGGKRK